MLARPEVDRAAGRLDCDSFVFEISSGAISSRESGKATLRSAMTATPEDSKAIKQSLFKTEPQLFLFVARPTGFTGPRCMLVICIEPAEFTRTLDFKARST